MPPYRCEASQRLEAEDAKRIYQDEAQGAEDAENDHDRTHDTIPIFLR